MSWGPQRLRDAVAHMYSGLGSFAKYVPGDVVRMLIQHRREAVLDASRQDISVRARSGTATVAEQC